MSLKTTPRATWRSPSAESGARGETLDLEELKGAVERPGINFSSIKRLLEEVRGLHEERLQHLEEDTSVDGEELAQKKVNFLRSYVNDLADQNQVLLQTMEDLQTEADDKLASWGTKLRTSDRNSKVSAADLKTLSVDRLLGPTLGIPHSAGSLEQIASELEDPKVQQPHAKDTVISHLEEEPGQNSQQKQKGPESSERLAHLQSQLSCLQRLQRDNVRDIAEKDVCITKLQASVELLRQEGAHTHTQLSQLQEELRGKEEEWRRGEDEQRRRYEEERRQEEQHQREREAEMRRVMEEERKALDDSVRKWAEKAAVLSSELKVSRKQVERQDRELSEAQQREELLRSEMKEKEQRVRHLDQDVAGLRATQDSLKRTLAMKETHTQQLVRDNTQLQESLASLQTKLQTNECMLSDTSQSLDQAKASLNAEREQRLRIQDQLHRASQEMERLQQELRHVCCSTEKKLQRREAKMCALVKELAESKKQHSECQEEALRREAALKELHEERDELRAKTESQGLEFVHLTQTKDRLEADLALSHEKVHTSQLEVRSRDQLIVQLRAEMKAAEQKHRRTLEQVAALEGEVKHLKHKVRGHQDEACQLSRSVKDVERLKEQKEKEQQQLQDQLCVSQQQVEAFAAELRRQEVETELARRQLKGAKEELRDASLQAQGQKETAAIFKQKYTAAMEKVHRVQGRAELLEEELQYSQQQLTESKLATHAVKDELAEMAQRYREKVGQWENSQEALDQLTDELQSSQKLLLESQQKVEHLKGLTGSLQEQLQSLSQQKSTLECDLRRYQQSHPHSDEEYTSLLRHRQQLQERCTEQVEHLAECEKAILQMKSELERLSQEKASLRQSFSASHRSHADHRSQLEQEVLRLKKEVARLELALADSQKAHQALVRQSEEELKQAGREAAAHRAEVQKLRGELEREGEETRSVARQRQSLSGRVRRLSQELEELRSKHQATVEELAARAEEARRMEGCLNEGKLAEGKIRSMAVRLETEAAELRRNLQQAVDHKLEAEREKRDARDQADSLRLELEESRSDNANLRRESQRIMANVGGWIAEHKASSESLAAQVKVQSKALLTITEEREHLQEANDTLKAEVKRLKEVADEKERDMERFKARIRDQDTQDQDEKTVETQSCVALNLGKIQDMQTRLRCNLEAIRMLNQQLNALSGENKRLRRQLEEERSMRLLLPPPPPPPPPHSSSSTSQRHSSVRLPFSLSGRPPPPTTFLVPRSGT